MLIVYMAVLFAAWLLFWLALPGDPGSPIWVKIANQVPGFAIALLIAEGLYRRSRATWYMALALAAWTVALGLLNQSNGGDWTGVYTGGQALIGAIEIVLLVLPPTRRWVGTTKS